MIRGMLLISFLFLITGSLFSQSYFSDDFENGLSKWVVSGQDWDTTSASYSSSNHSVTDSPVGNYAPNTDVRITMQNSLDLTSTTNPILIFWQMFYTQASYDFCIVEISGDGGFNWQEIRKFSGGNRTWSKVQLDLSTYKTSTVLIRFRLTSNGPSAELDGWYLDDVEVKELDSIRTPFPFTDRFENGLDKWSVGDLGWDTTSTSYASQNHSITDSPNENYTYYANTHLLLAHPIDLTSTTFPVLTFWQKFYTQASYDFCIIEISSDGGFNWQEIRKFDGGNRTWSNVQLDLSSYKTSTVLIRFRITSNGQSTELDGWYLDDVEIKELDTIRTPFPFTDNFENGIDNWSVDDLGWDTTSTTYASQNQSITDSPNENHTYYANTHLLLAHPIDLSSTTFPVLSFWQKYYTESSRDFCRIDISEDGGFNWIELHQFSGGNRTWSHVQLDLSSYKTTPVLIRFRLTSNARNAELDGWYLDDVEIKELDTIQTPFPFIDNFENGLHNWLSSAQDWDTTSSTYVSANLSITDSRDGKYPYFANTHLLLAHPIDLSNTTQPVLSFWQKYNTESTKDFCRVDVSQDGGFNWQEIVTYSGTNTAWHQEQFDLSLYKSSQVLLRFRLTSNGQNLELDGWYLDDVELYDLTGNRAPIIESFLANPTLGQAPLDVSFEVEASDTDGSIAEYIWDFNGDGINDDTTTTGLNSYIYSASGAYNATCRVTDDLGTSSGPGVVQINVYSDTTRIVSVPDDSASADATFLLPIQINEVGGIAGAEFKLNYDPSILEAKSASTTGLTAGFTISDSVLNGSVAITMARAHALASGSGDVVNITFHVLAGALAGQTSLLTLEQVTLYDADTNPISSTTENGLFTVKQSSGIEVTLKRIFIQPGLDTLSSDQTALYTAFGVDTDDNTVEIDVTWDYAHVFETPGGISPSSGHSTVFTATGIGDGFIAATYSSVTDTLVDTAYVIVGNIKGDINIDETVNVPDAILCLQIAADILDPSLYQNWAADFSNDHLVNSADGVGILTESLKGLLPKIGSSLTMSKIQGGPAVIYPVEVFNEASNLLRVSIFVENRMDVCGMDLIVDYDTSAFALVEISSGKPSSLLIKNIEGYKLSTINLEGLLSENGEIIHLYFQPKYNKAKKANFNIISVSLFDQQGNTIEAVEELNRAEHFSIPVNYILHQNYPNPFNPSTTIRYDVPKAGEVSLVIYNVKGQIVRPLVNDNMNAGTYTVTWKGDDNRGQMVSSGVYFYKIIFNHGAWQDVKKMLFVK